MPTTRGPKPNSTLKSENSSGSDVDHYSNSQRPEAREMCETLRQLIDAAMPRSCSRVWHGAPVWFIDENPVVGYTATAKSVDLLFWNGRAIDEQLAPVGKYQAAQARFAELGEIDPKTVLGWLKKAKDNVFDSIGFFKKLRESKARSKSLARKGNQGSAKAKSPARIAKLGSASQVATRGKSAKRK